MPFLTGQWRDLLMLTYAVEPSVLEPLLPPGVELDPFDGQPMASVVGFRFLDTRLKGIPLPFIGSFEEVNLRFYVRGRTPEGWKSGVCFVRELVPNRIVALGARKLYNEPYATSWMRHRVLMGTSGQPSAVEYWWYPHGRLNHMRATITGTPQQPRPGSLEAFAVQRTWGFTLSRPRGAQCYAVRHDNWSVQPVTEAVLDADVATVWGEPFAKSLGGTPVGALYTQGSAVGVDYHQPVPWG